MYLPSGEIATLLLWPVAVSFSIWSGKASERFRTPPLVSPRPLAELFRDFQTTRPPAARTSIIAVARPMGLLRKSLGTTLAAGELEECQAGVVRCSAVDSS